MRRTIRVVSVMEAHTVTGPAKNLIRFARLAREAGDNLPAVDLSFATFFRGGGTPSNEFIETARSAGIEVDVIAERRAFDLSVTQALADVVARREPHILQTHMIKGHFLVRFSKQLRSRQPWLAFHHGYTTENLKMRLYNELNRVSLPAADKVITVCSPFADVLSKQGVHPSSIEVLPNSVEPAPPVQAADIERVRRSLHLSPDDRILVSVGRFSSEKGHADLIPAMLELTRMLPALSIRHVLVGDGLERQNIERAIAEAGVGDRFIFAGHQRDVRPFYAMADVFVLPSHSEGSPNVLLEAMAAGLPIVSTAVGGVPDTVRHEASALLIQPRDPSALARSVAQLLTDESFRTSLAQTAASDAAERFSPAAYCRSLISLYERICHDRASVI